MAVLRPGPFLLNHALRVYLARQLDYDIELDKRQNMHVLAKVGVDKYESRLRHVYGLIRARERYA